jgi:hypothetical protein
LFALQWGRDTAEINTRAQRTTMLRVDRSRRSVSRSTTPVR